MGSAPATPDDLYASVAEEFLGVSGVTQPSDQPRPTTGFGSSALKVNNKIFAMLVGGKLVVKLPRQRVDALIAAGEGGAAVRGLAPLRPPDGHTRPRGW